VYFYFAYVAKDRNSKTEVAKSYTIYKIKVFVTESNTREVTFLSLPVFILKLEP
jgi:hypothetical protein